MSCNALSKGYKLSCMNANAGGVKSIIVSQFINDAILDRPAGGVLTNIPGISQAFKYELKNSANVLTDTSASDVNARTNTYTQSMTAVVNSTSAETMEELFQMTNGEIFVFVQFNNGDIKLMGAKYGVNTSYAMTSGGDRANGTSVTLTFTAVEDFPVLDLDASAITALNALIVE